MNIAAYEQNSNEPNHSMHNTLIEENSNTATDFDKITVNFDESVTTNNNESVKDESDTNSKVNTAFTSKNGAIRDHEFKLIPIKDLTEDPHYARLIENKDTMEAIANGIKQSGGLPEEHAILVRENDKQYQIIDGHLRYKVAKNMNLKLIPATIVKMNDEDMVSAQIALNTKHPLYSLEIGIRLVRFVLRNPGGSGKKGGQKDYTKMFGKSESMLTRARYAAKVYLDYIESIEDKETLESTKEKLIDKTEHLYEISKVKDTNFLNAGDIRSALVQCLIEEDWTVRITKKVINKIKSDKTVYSSLSIKDIAQRIKYLAKTKKERKPTQMNNIISSLSSFTKYGDDRKIDVLNSFLSFADKIKEDPSSDDKFHEALQDHIDECQALFKRKAA